MGLLLVVATVVLVIVNVLVALASFFFLLVGIALAAAADMVQNYVLPNMETLLPTSGEGDLDFSALFDPNLDIFGKMRTFAIPIIIVALVILIISFLGCIGACCKNKCMLGVYAVVMSIIFVGVLAGCLALYLTRDKAFPAMEASLGEMVKEDYVDERHSDVISVMFTVLQVEANCCGSKNGGDYIGSTVLNRTVAANQVIPLSCCQNFKLNNNPPLSATEALLCTTGEPQNEQVSNYNLGCAASIWQRVTEYTNYVLLGIALSMLAVLVLCVLGWVLFVNAMKKKKVNDNEQYKY